MSGKLPLFSQKFHHRKLTGQCLLDQMALKCQDLNMNSNKFKDMGYLRCRVVSIDVDHSYNFGPLYNLLLIVLKLFSPK